LDLCLFIFCVRNTSLSCLQNVECSTKLKAIGILR